MIPFTRSKFSVQYNPKRYYTILLNVENKASIIILVS